MLDIDHSNLSACFIGRSLSNPVGNISSSNFPIFGPVTGSPLIDSSLRYSLSPIFCSARFSPIFERRSHALSANPDIFLFTISVVSMSSILPCFDMFISACLISQSSTFIPSYCAAWIHCMSLLSSTERVTSTMLFPHYHSL